MRKNLEDEPPLLLSACYNKVGRKRRSNHIDTENQEQQAAFAHYVACNEVGNLGTHKKTFATVLSWPFFRLSDLQKSNILFS